MKIYLIGLPGSGKTTLGRQLAKVMNVVFVDLDSAIEKAEEKTIPEIFSEKGEERFRSMEAEQLREITESHNDFVMATGGGAPCFHKGIEFMNQNGISVFLNVPVPEIAVRMNTDEKTERPLLAGLKNENVVYKLNRLLDERIKFYRQATLTVSKASIQAEEILELLKVHLKK